MSYVKRILRKIRSEGFVETSKAAGRFIQCSMHQPDWDFELVPSVLEKIVQEKQSVVIVQIGANVGNTNSDQLYGFLKKHCCETNCKGKTRCRAVLVEPVKHLFEQLTANYAGFEGVECENVAIAEVAGTRNFYRLREGIDPVAQGLPAFAHELGSFLPENLTSLWSHDPGNETLRKFVDANIVIDKIPCLTINDLLRKHGLSELDFLQIDTEGYDYQVLRALNFQEITPRYINYERIHLQKDESRCRNMLLNHHYNLHDHGQDTFCSLGLMQSPFKRWRERAYNIWLNSIY